jgi:hypothetical protein
MGKIYIFIVLLRWKNTSDSVFCQIWLRVNRGGGSSTNFLFYFDILLMESEKLFTEYKKYAFLAILWMNAVFIINILSNCYTNENLPFFKSNLLNGRASLVGYPKCCRPSSKCQFIYFLKHPKNDPGCIICFIAPYCVLQGVSRRKL